MRKAFSVALGLALLVAGMLPAGAAPKSWPGNAPYSVSKDKLDQALECAGYISENKYAFGTGAAGIGAGKGEPVLLVHGTGATREQNWRWNYWQGLQTEGYDVCWVQLPSSSLGDAQISAEYVARAIEVIAAATGEKVDVIGHSQGGLQPRWAIKWFPSGPRVDDYISLATPNHGTVVADAASPLFCFDSCWQMRTDSNFIAALNGDEETPGKISYTNIYTATDELVQPVGTQALDGATNILLQDLCPGRPVDHLGIAADYVTWELVLSALVPKGGARVEALSADACTKVTMPGSSAPQDNNGDFSEGEAATEEPPLMPYAR